MKYSYLGMSKPMHVINNILRKHINEFRRHNPGVTPPLEPGGVFASNPTSASMFAGDNGMCVHYTFSDLINKSDIIFVFLPEKSLEKLSLSVAKYDVKGKIFCHASPAFASSILDVNSYNTYASILVTSSAGEGRAASNFGSIMLEGYGRKYDSFREALNAFGVSHYSITAEEKKLYLTGVNFVKDFPVLMDSVGKKLIKMSLADVPEAYNDVMKITETGIEELTSYNALELDDRACINRQNDMLDNIGLDRVTDLFKAITNINRK